MRYLKAPDLGPCPEVWTSVQWGSRARDLNKWADMQRVRHGLYARYPRALRPAQRAALLQPRLGGYGTDPSGTGSAEAGSTASNLRVTGLSALELLGLPVGLTSSWVHHALELPYPPKVAQLKQRAAKSHLAWHGRRTQTRADDVLLTKALGLAVHRGPWGCSLVDPIEALVVSADVLSLWRLVACLDVLLSLEIMIPRVHTLAIMDRESMLRRLGRLQQRSERVRRVYEALEHAQPRTWSPMETLLRMLVAAAGFPAPVMNHPVLVVENRWFLDLAWPEVRVALEYSGDVHAVDPATYRSETYRSNLLRDHGWEVRNLVLDDLKFPYRRFAWLEWLRERL